MSSGGGRGSAAPYGVGLWQIGNETSYGTGGFAKDEAIARTAEFAREMRRRDPSIRLIGWGDGDGRELWAGDMVRRAGEQLDFIAIHMMQQLPTEPGTVLRGTLYQRDPERAWEELLALSRHPEARLVELEQVLDATGTPMPIAVTEGHLSLAPHNTNPILMEWLSGAYHARMLNLYQRHGDRVRIATIADFNGTRWTTVAIRLQVPRGISYLTPAGSVMRLFGRHNGTAAVSVKATRRSWISRPAAGTIGSTCTSRTWMACARSRSSSRSRAGALPAAGCSPSHPRICALPSTKTIRKCSRRRRASLSVLAGGFPRARSASSSLSFARCGVPESRGHPGRA